jgi:hypothetical protein
MIETFAAVGDADAVRKKLSAYAELADQVILSPPDQLIDLSESERYRAEIIQAFGQ